MQAASINVQPAPQTPQADLSRDTSPASAGMESRIGLSFQEILSRNLRETPPPEGRAVSRKIPVGELRQGVAGEGPTGKVPANRDLGPTVEPGKPGTVILRGGSKDLPRQNSETPGTPLSPTAEEAELLPGLKELSKRSQKTGTSPEGAERTGNRPKAREPRPEATAGTEDSVAFANAPRVARAPSSESRGHELEAKAPESASADKRRNDRRDTKVFVQDLRMRPRAAEPEASRESNRPVEASSTGKESSSVGARSAEGPVPSERVAEAKPQGGMSFSDTLARHIADAGAQDIVKAAHIVLRDGDAGLIRLRLEPESLGNVKIELKLTEKNITGRIVVETDEARNAFEKSLSTLRDAFTAGGFETASLEVSVGGGEARGREDPSDTGGDPFFSERLRDLDRSVPAVVESAVRADGGVNIWA